MSSLAEEISKLHDLHVNGVLSAEEFADAKKALIASIMASKGVVANKDSTLAPAATVSASAAHPQPSSSSAATVSESGSSVAPPSSLKNSSPSQSAGGGGLFRADQPGQARETSSSFETAVDVSLFETSHVGAHDVAYRHLVTILNNVIAYPSEIKYRRLRRSNAKLAAELFTSPGAERLLASCGFRDMKEEGAAGTDEYLVLPSVGTSNSSEQQIIVDRLKTAVEAVKALQQRDSAAAVEAANAAKLMRTVALDIRRERCRNALAQLSRREGEGGTTSSTAVASPPPKEVKRVNPHLSRMAPFEAFVASMFLLDDVNDGLALDNARKLLTLEENALKSILYASSVSSEERDDENAASGGRLYFEANLQKYLRLPLSNVAASKLVLGQKGAAEALIHIAGWAIRATSQTFEQQQHHHHQLQNKIVTLWGDCFGDVRKERNKEGKEGIEAGLLITDAALMSSSYVPYDVVIMSSPPKQNDSEEKSTASSFHPHPILSFGDLIALNRCGELKALEDKARKAISFFKSIVLMLEDEARQAAMRDREQALAIAKAEMQKGLTEERSRQRREEMKKGLAAVNAHSFDDNGGSGVRVKTADAIRYLLGKESREDVLERAKVTAIEERERRREKQAAAAMKSRLLRNYDNKSGGAPTDASNNEIKADDIITNARRRGRQLAEDSDTAATAGASSVEERGLLDSAVAADDFDSDWSDE